MKIKVMSILLCVSLIGQNVTALAEEAGHNESKVVESDVSYSQWAEESIKNAVEVGLVPEDLQSDYKDKITRGEFCRLAVQTYVVKTESELNMDIETPFTDVDDAYITTAYNLKIVSGVGDDKFAPDNYITRQEAAVMLNNLAYVLNIDNSIPQSEKFVDESYFADWAKSAVYSVAGIKSGDTYVMTGTGNGKFSPWMNYTREQAVATMWRLYNCMDKVIITETTAEATTETIVAQMSEIYFDNDKKVQMQNEFKNKNVQIAEDAVYLEYINDNKFIIGFNNEGNAYNGFFCDSYGLIDLDGKYIIPAANNYMIYIGYGKIVKFDGPIGEIDSELYTVYDLNGNELDLNFNYMDVYTHMGQIDAFYKRISDETGGNKTVRMAASLGLIASEINILYTQFDWNVTRQQLCDFIMKLYCKINSNAESTKINKVFSDSYSKNANILYNLGVVNAVEEDKFYPYADITPQEAKEVFSNFMKLLNLEESVPDVFVTNYSEYYTVEQMVMTVFNIYKLYYPEEVEKVM